jgi:hypothetical protein
MDGLWRRTLGFLICVTWNQFLTLWLLLLPGGNTTHNDHSTNLISQGYFEDSTSYSMVRVPGLRYGTEKTPY